MVTTILLAENPRPKVILGVGEMGFMLSDL